jgi:fructose-bisphosphate aldolase, class I
MYEQIRGLIQDARKVGLPTIIWSYPRGGNLSKDGETAIDVVAYAAHIACQLGAHIVKVKPPTAHIEQDAARKFYEKVKIDTMADRVRHVVQSCFNGKRIVIFSGGAVKGTDEVVEELRQIHAGGGFGTIMGRNAFQRSRADGAALLKKAIEIFAKNPNVRFAEVNWIYSHQATSSGPAMSKSVSPGYSTKAIVFRSRSSVAMRLSPL